MPLNRDFIGRRLSAEGTFEVSREHIRRFADAIGDPNPAYRDRAAAAALGHPDVIAPPTFLTTIGMSMAGLSPIDDPALGLDYGRATARHTALRGSGRVECSAAGVPSTPRRSPAPWSLGCATRTPAMAQLSATCP